MLVKSTYLLLAIILGTGIVQAQVPIPSKWEGKVTGRVYGIEFSLPITIEISSALPHEKNPFHLFIGSTSNANAGDLLLVSAMQVSTDGGGIKYGTGSAMGVYTERQVPHSSRQPSSGSALLQYFTIKLEGSQVTGVLTNVNRKEAATVNVFTGPNVSAREASELMRGVMESLGTTEIFTFLQGAELQMRFDGGVLNGNVSGKGRSVLNTSSDVSYTCRFQASRIQ